jgi:hypothetical protein
LKASLILSLIQKIKPLNLMYYHIHLQVLSIFQMIS